MPENWAENTSIAENRYHKITLFIKMSHHFKLCQETLFISIRLFDVISSKEKLNPTSEVFFFIACVHLVCKYEESKYFWIENFIEMFSQPMNRSQIILAEEKLLKVLDFWVSTYTPYDFLKRIAQIFKLTFE